MRSDQRHVEEQLRRAYAGTGIGPWEHGAVVTNGTLREAIEARVLELRARRREIGREAADFEAASAYGPYRDDEQVGRFSSAGAAAGITVLQAHLLAADEREHVRRLLEFFDPPRGAPVLDAGCGIGGVARHMQELRPDLAFMLLNTSRAQLELCPRQLPRVVASIEDMGVPAQRYVGIMFLHVLGHARLDLAFAEAARVTRPGGVMLIYDLVAEDSERLIAAFGYCAHSESRITETAKRYGFVLDRAQQPQETVPSPGIAPLGDAVYAEIFGGTRSMMFRFTSCGADHMKERHHA